MKVEQHLLMLTCYELAPWYLLVLYRPHSSPLLGEVSVVLIFCVIVNMSNYKQIKHV